MVRALHLRLVTMRPAHDEASTHRRAPAVLGPEHFGFADGLSQPIVEGGQDLPRPGQGEPDGRGGWRPLRAGEFVLGYEDEEGVLPPSPAAPLGHNGTFMVWRKLRQDVESHAIAGISSGGICAFTAAWERPDKFSKVLSWVGSFTGIAARLDETGRLTRPGGNNYPVLIRKTTKKPIRVFQQDGENDLDNNHGNWPLANREMDKALAFAGYDHRFVMGNGFHSDRHGRAILPESLRWLWRK